MKIGAVLVTHYRLGEEFLQALKLILPEAPVFAAVSVDPAQPVEALRQTIATKIAAMGGIMVRISKVVQPRLPILMSRSLYGN